MRVDDAIEEAARRFRRVEELRQLVEDASSPGSFATLLSKTRRYEKEFGVFVWSYIEAIREETSRRRRYDGRSRRGR